MSADFFILFIKSIQRYEYTWFLMKKKFLYEMEIETLQYGVFCLN